jgi:hypothetical protein
MKVSKFSEQKIALILKQVDDGLGIEEVCRKAGVPWPVDGIVAGKSVAAAAQRSGVSAQSKKRKKS